MFSRLKAQVTLIPKIKAVVENEKFTSANKCMELLALAAAEQVHDDKLWLYTIKLYVPTELLT